MGKKPIHAKPSLYAFYYETLKEIAKDYGYNLVLHGSMNRDLDLIAIPWMLKLGNVDEMIDKFCSTIGGEVLMNERSVLDPVGVRFTQMNHGRIIYVININRDFELLYNGMKVDIKEYSDPQYYIDISVIKGDEKNI